MIDFSKLKMEGHVLIKNSETQEILVSKSNSIHFENMSTALAKSLAHRPDGHLHEMEFGNGGASVSGTGEITFLPPNVSGSTAQLYNPTFIKVIDDQSPLNLNPSKNFMEVKHTNNTVFSDIVVTATLDFNEPSGQEAFDTSVSSEGDFIFDELGLKTFSDISGGGLLITHVVFHPIQKSLNRLIEIVYTIRITIT